MLWVFETPTPHKTINVKGAGRRDIKYELSISDSGQITLKIFDAINWQSPLRFGTCINSLDDTSKALEQIKDILDIISDIKEKIDIGCGKVVKEDKENGIKYQKHDVTIYIDPAKLSDTIDLLYTILYETYDENLDDFLIYPATREELDLILNLNEDEIPEGVKIKYAYADYSFLRVEEEYSDDDPYYFIIDKEKFGWVFEMLDKKIDESEKIKDNFSVFLDKLNDAIPLRERVIDALREKYKELVNKILREYISKINKARPETSPPPFSFLF